MSYTRLIKLGKAMNKLERGKCARSYTSACWDPIAYNSSPTSRLEVEMEYNGHEETDDFNYETVND